ncbi:MAG TPA: ParB/RepB/Spo0J family partition protein [Actinomycetes bacterium]|nr:ParB/RepB/Spo0J family partition protein [Actinomycetes bacterium]
MSDRRRGLGRGLGALIPTGPARPEAGAARLGDSGPSGVDVLIPTRPGVAEAGTADAASATGAASTAVTDPAGVPADGAADQGAADQSAAGRPEVAPVPGAYFAELPVEQIVPNARQPRQVFDEEAMAELVHSLREIGLLQPIVVREVGPQHYELIMGERRWRAAQLAGFTRIPAIVRSTDDDAMLRDALLENLHRSQLNPLEEAAAYQQLLDDFGCTHEELAGRIGRSRPQISNTLRLLKLPPTVQRRVAAAVLSAGHARALLGLAEADAQERLAARIVAEGLSVRAVEEIVAVGDDAPATRSRSRANRPVAPGLVELAERLSDRFETRVSVNLGRRRGKIVVEFASIADLERIVGLLDASGPAAAD